MGLCVLRSIVGLLVILVVQSPIWAASGMADWGYALKPDVQAKIKERLAHIPSPAHGVNDPFLMPVEDVLSIRGQGTVVTGRVERGTVKRGDDIEIVGLGPTRRTVITGVEMFKRVLIEARAGDNVACRLKGIEKKDVERGQVLARPGSIAPYTRFRAEVYMLKKEEGGRHTHFLDGYRPQFYLRTTDVSGVAKLRSGVDAVMPGANVTLDVELTSPIALEKGQRFAIREGGRTVGAGAVIELLSQAGAGVPAATADSSGPACIQSFVAPTIERSSNMWESLVKLVSSAFGAESVEERNRLRELRNSVGALFSAKEELLLQIRKFEVNPTAASWTRMQRTLESLRSELSEVANQMKVRLAGTSFGDSQTFAELYTTLDRKRQSTLCELSAPMPRSDAEMKELSLVAKKLSSEIEDIKSAHRQIGEILAQR